MKTDSISTLSGGESQRVKMARQLPRTVESMTKGNTTEKWLNLIIFITFSHFSRLKVCRFRFIYYLCSRITLLINSINLWVKE